MREIKFRFLDTSSKKLYSSLEGLYVANEWTERQTYEWFAFKALAGGFDNIVLLQFTGLKDRNGKEIYEGDIVQVPAGFCGDYQYESINATVIYSSEEPQFELQPYPCQDEWNWNDLKVIGNIHENPEMVEGTK